MKAFLAGCALMVLVTLLSPPANGAERSPAYNWTGFYVGVNGGGGWGHSRHDFEAAGTTTGDYRISGATAGGTLGANLQAGGLLLGVEGDMNWSDIGGSDPCPNANFTCRTRSKWLATTRGRVGYAIGRVLPYVTAARPLAESAHKFLILEVRGKPKWVGRVAADSKLGYSVGSAPSWNTSTLISARSIVVLLAAILWSIKLSLMHIWSVSG
jgi:outer membrane immunogenic protein